jgi:L-2-hydroxyglutarate oxidase
MATYDYAVIGGGIVGLSAALHIGQKYPRARILLVEKESTLAQHQTGRNSGVIHSGIYYKPGSYKARFAKAGAESMVRFCAEQGIPFDVCGKVIVATRPSELAPLEDLYQRGMQNGVPVERLTHDQVREIEPHVRCLAGLHVKSTGITSYQLVCEAYFRLIVQSGGTVKMDTEVKRIEERGNSDILHTSTGEYEARFVINCAGLYSDRVARASGTDPKARIVPFRGEYFELVPDKRHLVRTLIYPVPNPDFPFLGVHFTRMIDGSVHAGPNAVLAFAREGYRKTDINVGELWETLSFGGFWKLVRQNLGEGLKEMYRSLSKAAFTHSLQQLIPEVRSGDLIPCAAGIRAQALTDDGKLVDDFLIIPAPRAMHVCNAPSPAATASLEIGKEIASRVPPV